MIYTEDEVLAFAKYLTKKETFELEAHLKNWSNDLVVSDLASLRNILLKTCNLLEVGVSDVQGKSRKSNFVRARQIYCYLARKLTPYSLEVIGEIINRDHATIIYKVKKAISHIENERDYEMYVAELLNELKNDKTQQ